MVVWLFVFGYPFVAICVGAVVSYQLSLDAGDDEASEAVGMGVGLGAIWPITLLGLLVAVPIVFASERARKKSRG